MAVITRSRKGWIYLFECDAARTEFVSRYSVLSYLSLSLGNYIQLTLRIQYEGPGFIPHLAPTRCPAILSQFYQSWDPSTSGYFFSCGHLCREREALII
jgi:hypothetical protein